MLKIISLSAILLVCLVLNVQNIKNKATPYVGAKAQAQINNTESTASTKSSTTAANTASITSKTEAEMISCLNEKGATMYGTEWCPHCKHQKLILGANLAKLKYIDCDKQAKICESKGVNGYPTWLLANGREIYAGKLDYLAKQAGCL